MNAMRTLVISAVLGGALASGWMARAEDWPQWRGPDLDGVSKETEWSPEIGDELWSIQVGLGYSSVVVKGEKLYTMGWAPPAGAAKKGGKSGEDTVFCLDTETGETLWRHSFPAKKWDKYHGGGTNCTPTLVGDALWVMNREAKLLCLDAEDGEVRWEKDLNEGHSLKIPTWAFAASPLAVDGRVIVNVGSLIAYSEKGEELWASEDLGHAYSTPYPTELGGEKVLIAFNGSGLSVVDRTNGEVLQRQQWKTQHSVNAATPIMIDDKRCFISSGYNRGCAMIELSLEEAPKVLWESKIMRNKMAGSVLFEDHLYGFDENMLKCIDLNGEEKWRQRGLGSGAHTVAGDHLIVLADDGSLITAPISSSGFEEVGRWDCLDGGRCWTPPVLSGGLIFCRNSQGHLVCHDHAAGAPD